ncbi:transporter YjgP/YjgQ [Acetobacter oeni LMG 21952]|nr:LptF/LptG family permease [Acetobacter oeni]NHO19602.1 LptF/LptG family permease [Acetobacter oeni]GBR05491.1 transporter YjgP/YjgQ [Acetobacter oeni LMG 21952]
MRPGTLDVYLISQTIPPFIIAVSVVLLALLLERMLVLLNVLASEASPFFTLIRLLADLMPHYMGLALPAALCVSVFAVIRRMSENDEIDVLMSSGVSLARICRPFAITGAVIGLLSLALYGYLQPHARYQFRQGFYMASHAGWSPVLQSGMFAAPSAALMLTADHVDQAGSHLTGVFIRDLTEDKERDIIARTGHIRTDPAKGEVQIELTDGEILTVRPDQDPGVTTFDHATRLLSHTHTSAFRERGDDERELTSGELVHRIHRRKRARHGQAEAPPPVPAPPAATPASSSQTQTSDDTPRPKAAQTDTIISVPSMRAELNFRLARSLSIPFIPILAAALAVIGKRKRGSAGLALAVTILLTYDHLLQLGESLVANGRTSPLAVIWPPTIVFCAGCTLLLLFRARILPIIRVTQLSGPAATDPDNHA